MKEKLYSMFTFERLRNLHLQVPRLLASGPTKYLSCKVVCSRSHSFGLAAKQRKLSSLKRSVLRAHTGILAQAEERYVLLGLHVSFAKQKTAHLNGLFTGDGLREMLKGRATIIDQLTQYVFSQKRSFSLKTPSKR